ncbi:MULTISPECIES: hypothetical protein [unclassified Streptomyces]|uniref:hypothetical protein n=1 Tax=unclassified Streptomyces TaxID=2593676 RepID=UPI004041D092
MFTIHSRKIATAVAAAAAMTATGLTYASAASVPVPQAAPAVTAAPSGGPSTPNTNEGKGNEGKGNEGREGGGPHRHFEGRILFNEREYSGRPDGCITVVSGLGAKTLNIRNDSRNVVEVFRGAVCDNGAPVATVGPFSSANGVCPRFRDDDEHENENCEEREHHEKGEHHENGEHHEEMEDGVKVKNGVIASFRVVCRHGIGEGGGFGRGDGFFED